MQDDIAADSAVTKGVPAVRRACAVLWLLSRHQEGRTLSRIARDAEILPSTCLHILRELAAARLVAYDPNAKLYRLGNGVLTLGRQLTQQNPFAQLAQPHLQRLSREFDVGASAQERDGDDGLLVVAAASAVPGDMVTPGGRTPLFTSASGRLLAAFGDYTEADLHRRFNRARWQQAPDYEVWLKDVRKARASGLATDEGCFRKGITAIAAAVPDAQGEVLRTISITCVTAQLDAARRKRIAAAVEQAARQISESLH